VTLQIGANDALICQQFAVDRCISHASLLDVAQTVQGNLDRIHSALPDVYDGQFVVTYYALDHADQTGVAIQLLDNGIA
jgi:hypothetical protein